MPLAIEERVDTLEAVLGEFIVSTNRALIRMERGIADLREEMNADREEMKAYREEMKADREEMNRRWGDLANKMGTIVEDMVAPNVPGIAREYFGIEAFDFFAVRVRKKNNKDRSLQREFDVIAISEDSFILVDVKSNPRQAYIDDFLDVLKKIPDYFVESAQKRLIPLFASLYIPENILSYLTRKGVYAMAIKEETMGLLNFEEVK